MECVEGIEVFSVRPESAGQRLDRFLGDVYPLEPREVLREVVRRGLASVNDAVARPEQRLRKGDRVAVRCRAEVRKSLNLDIVRPPILYRDAHVVVVDKPAGVTVAGERSGAGSPLERGVLDVLARSDAAQRILALRFRPRVVHRLDRETSGALIFAISPEGEFHLKRQFQERNVGKEYLVVVHGEVPRERGEIAEPVAADSRDLRRMRLDRRGGKPAQTRYEVIERFRGFTLLNVQPLTGRRHQIRIHLAHSGHPVVGDAAYGGSLPMLSRIKRGYRHKRGKIEKPLIGRATLHARAVTFTPVDGSQPLRVEAPIPRDVTVLLKMLRKYARGGAPSELR